MNAKQTVANNHLYSHFHRNSHPRIGTKTIHCVVSNMTAKILLVCYLLRRIYRQPSSLFIWIGFFSHWCVFSLKFPIFSYFLHTALCNQCGPIDTSTHVLKTKEIDPIHNIHKANKDTYCEQIITQTSEQLVFMINIASF